MKSILSVAILCLLLLSMPIMSVLAEGNSDEIEPNDTREQATEVTTYFVDGEIGVDGDVEDWFTVTIYEVDLEHNFYLLDVEEGQRVDLEVYSDENVVGTSVTGDTPGFVQCYVPGTCYVRVLGTEGQGNYRLYIETPVEIFMPGITSNVCCWG